MQKSVTINNIILQKVEHIKFLGVIIELKLSWSPHMSWINRKVSRGKATLFKARRLLKALTLVTLYYGYGYIYFTYCIVLVINIWVLRSMFRKELSSSYLAHTLPISSNLKILNIYNIYNYQVLIFMLKHKKGLLPLIVNDMLIQNNTIHSHNTRQANNINVSAFQSRLSQQTIRFTGTKLWNFMYYKLKTNSSLSSYKHSLKEYIVADGFPII